MNEIIAKQHKEIKGLLLVQFAALFIAALLAEFMSGEFLSVLFGGVVVMLSTWHVHTSVYKSEGDRRALLQMAGVRFIVMLLLLGVAIMVFKFGPLYLVAGMATVYVAMYVKSLLMIFDKMKGDSRE